MLSSARFLGCLLGGWIAFSGWAAEPWTDPRLPVTNGIALWLDASRQTAGRGAQGLGPLRSWADAPEALFDGSGHGRHFLQPLREARPAFRIDWGTTALAFDGANDHLTAFLPGSALRSLSAFLVASPHAVGGFQGLLAANALGRNDYLTGFNFDFGGAVPTNLLTALNLEGPGFAGEQNLLLQPSPLRQWHRFAFFVGGSNGVQASLDGKIQKSRPRTSDAPLSFEEITLGARRYSNTADRPHAQGFFQGLLAEVVLYDRVLTEAERNAVEQYLDAKYGAVLHGAPGATPLEGEVPLITVSDPPPMQVHYPGFAAEELPVRLNNVNNVRYRPDGVLVAVGYDGRLWLLRDSNGDGAEDEARLFFDGRQSLRAPIGAALTPPGYARGNGLFVAAKDRLALVVDTDGDDQADRDITVATWTETSIQKGVDALGVAVAPDGSVYFSLGSASYIEPFLVDSATGKAGYHTRQERGTILRVSPDFSKREIVCTGIRFAVGMAFNRLGDLFVTDQEGATWRHDGNPLDELLHIQPGRHYGFPPRHPRHLPEVFDEPSVFDYGPQHQSTCGLAFNAYSGSSGESWFGPAHWREDALVAGYSRGKLWKTKLVKTGAGYVAQTDLIATLQQLTVDATVSPAGDLIVATHSGQPDWGSGPNGAGHLWRLRYQDRDTPQPVVAWNASPAELNIAFDRPLPAQAVKDLSQRARIESGLYVFSGDRFETVRPGYQVVYDQLAAPRRAHEILTAQVSPDRRTLILVTRPRETAVNYAVTLPAASAARGETDLLTRLNGVEGEWTSAKGDASVRLWLPHVDLAVARQLTAGSAEHERFFAALQQPGTLVLRGQLDLWQMLQPAIQPGAAIEWVRPPETVRVQFRSPSRLEVEIGNRAVQKKSSDSDSQYDLEIRAPGQDWHSFQLRMPTGPESTLLATWSTDEDPRARAFPLRRFFSPWAKRADDSNAAPLTRAAPDPALAGGNWLHGRRLFFSDRLACAQCHRIRGEGARVGPELSNLIHRDAASVRKDIEFPNAAINPDHVASVIERTDGESFTGIILEERQGTLRVILAAGAVEEIPSSSVRTTQPSAQSLMPEGLWAAMN
ncbi:MAG: PQQ-dependent sugar dehydrogenase, partial [Verrucomicrobiae bacterium]|nr:PQQ-dependent sugar dehydrogenase [Verrucomicrobiae bacterium]